MSGCNIANYDDWRISIFSHSENNQCIFISHKKEDEDAAIEIGEFLTNIAGLNIYLDTKDFELKEAVSIENDRKIVDSIKKGLNNSTHLLCLISDKTKLSWWVPFEIGFAENKNVEISVLKLKGVDDLPSFLKIKNTINTIDDFLKYVSEVMPFVHYFANSNYNKLRSENISALERYIER